MFGSGLRRGDIEQALGDAFAGTIPNNYALVREAIDRGIPLEEVKAGNNVVSAVEEAIVRLQKPARMRAKTEAGEKKMELFGAR